MADSVKLQSKISDAFKAAGAKSLTSPPPSKKPRQTTLNFKVLTEKPIISQTSPVGNSSKKRKLSSDVTTPIGKAPKTPKKDENTPTNQKKNKVNDAENEVSSSSEAELIKKREEKENKCKGATILERFVRSTQQEEVTTTGEIVDLTDSNDATESSNSKAESVDVNVSAKKNVPRKSSDTDKKDTADCDETAIKDESNEDVKDEVEEDCGSHNEKSTAVTDELDMGKLSESVAEEAANSSLISIPEDEASVLDSSQMDTEDEKEEAGQDEEETSPKTADSAKTPTPSNKKRTRPKVKTPANLQKETEKQKKKGEREKLRVEKLKQQDEEKVKKQKEKEEKEKKRKEEKERKEKEKEELKQQKEKERLEKAKEKEEKLKQKQDLLDAKAEKKRKDDEGKRVEEEKKKQGEEEQMKKKARVKNQFASFFTKSATPALAPDEKEETTGPFMAFQLKDGMRLAPYLRLDQQQRQLRATNLDNSGWQQQESAKLYVEELRSRSIKMFKKDKLQDEDDVMIVEGEEEIPVTKAKTMMRAKFLKFRENYRPPYYGTWRKKSKHVTARRPLGQDKDQLDYEVDSDEEWEEEEPGESLSGSEGEGEEDAGEDEEEDSEGFFVPHGYLSEDEGCEEDEEDATPERLKARQLAKAKAFEEEMKQKCELLKPIYIGCLWWAHELAYGDPNYDKLAQFKAIPLVDTVPIAVTESTVSPDCSDAALKASGPKLKPVPDEALPDLIRLVHGNRFSVQKLIREFREYWRIKSVGGEEACSAARASVGTTDPMLTSTANGESECTPVSSTASSPSGKSTSPKEEVLISKRQLDIKIRAIATYEKREHINHGRWFVSDAVLEQYGMSDISVPTKWQWITKFQTKKESNEEPQTPKSGRETPKGGRGTPTGGRGTPTPTTPNLPSIKAFAVPTSQLPPLPTPSPIRPKPSENSQKVDQGTPTSHKPKLTPGQDKAKKKPNTLNIATLFSQKRNSLAKQKAECDNKLEVKSKGAEIKTDAKTEIIVIDDDCMIVDEPAPSAPLPTVAPKGQRTLSSMFTTKPSV